MLTPVTASTFGFYVCPACGAHSAGGRCADLQPWKVNHRSHLGGLKFQFHTAFVQVVAAAAPVQNDDERVSGVFDDLTGERIS